MSKRLERVDYEEPTTPMGRLADSMFTLITDDSVRAIIMLVNDETGEGMTATHGYDPDSREALVDLLGHLQAIAAGSGMRLDLMSMDDGGVLRVEGFEAYEEEK